MKSRRENILKSIAVYYAQVSVFILASYGLIYVIYGRIGISFLEWTLILMLAFTLGFIPNLVRFLRGNAGL